MLWKIWVMTLVAEMVCEFFRIYTCDPPFKLIWDISSTKTIRTHINSIMPFGSVQYCQNASIDPGSGNGLLPIWSQAIAWTNAEFSSIDPLWRNFNVSPSQWVNVVVNPWEITCEYIPQCLMGIQIMKFDAFMQNCSISSAFISSGDCNDASDIPKENLAQRSSQINFFHCLQMIMSTNSLNWYTVCIISV